jgi:CheY-like chemotaxis protein
MWKDKTVMIVEDDENSTELLSEILEETDVTLLYAQDGNTAVDLCKKRNVDVVLMDIQLPGMSGYSAFIEIKKVNKAIIVIAQTAYAMAGDRDKYLTLGFDNYIAKPICHGDMIGLLCEYLGKD